MDGDEHAQLADRATTGPPNSAHACHAPTRQPTAKMATAVTKTETTTALTPSALIQRPRDAPVPRVISSRSTKSATAWAKRTSTSQWRMTSQ